MDFRGNVDVAANTFFSGWCSRIDGEPGKVRLHVNDALKAIFPADRTRSDLIAAGLCRHGGGFQFDAAAFIPQTGDVKIELRDESGNLLPRGQHVISASQTAQAYVRQITGDISHLSVGIFGNTRYALDLGAGSALSKMLAVLGVTTLERPDRASVNLWFCHPTNPKPVRDDLLNGAFLDASKSAIDVAHRAVFGRGVCVARDEINPSSEYVVKSEKQAAHDGRVKTGREITGADYAAGVVVQRLIDNRIDSLNVQDIRVPYIGGDIPFAYLKTRPIGDRFSNGNKTTCVVGLRHVLSDDEAEQVRQFCKYLSVDYAELDVLRDRRDGAIWIADVNNTPSGPPNGLSRGESEFAVREMALTFFSRFLMGRVCRQGCTPQA